MPPVLYRQKLSSNILLRSDQGGKRRNDKPEGWAKNHGEQRAESHSQGAELTSDQKILPNSRVLTASARNRFTIAYGPVTAMYFLFYPFPSGHVFVQAIVFSFHHCIGWMKPSGSTGALWGPDVDLNMLGFKQDAMTWDLGGSWDGSEYVLHVTAY